MFFLLSVKFYTVQYVIYFQMAIKLLGHKMYIKLFGPTYLINGDNGYFFWFRDTLKKLLSH